MSNKVLPEETATVRAPVWISDMPPIEADGVAMGCGSRYVICLSPDGTAYTGPVNLWHVLKRPWCRIILPTAPPEPASDKAFEEWWDGPNGFSRTTNNRIEAKAGWDAALRFKEGHK